VQRLAYLNVFHEDEPYIPLGAGLYCVGATMLQQVYSSVNAARGRASGRRSSSS
jgi:hypothetical protein